MHPVLASDLLVTKRVDTTRILTIKGRKSAPDPQRGVWRMRIAPLADVKARLSAYLDQCEREEPVVITRNGRPVAVLLAPLDEDDLEGLLLARSPRFRALLEKSRRSIRSGKALTHKDFWRAVAQRYKRSAAKRVAEKQAWQRRGPGTGPGVMCQVTQRLREARGVRPGEGSELYEFTLAQK
jgi:prevent-host-death family protein